MKRCPHRIPTVLILILALLVGSCGGGGIVSVAGIEGTGISSGTITGFGSVIVNGTTFDTTGATYIFNSENGNPDDFEVGDVVRVEGVFNGDGTGSANRVIFARNVDGPIEDIDLIDGEVTITALGQTIIVTEDTQFIGTALANLDDDDNDSDGTDLIAVSGFDDGQGNLIATSIRQNVNGFIATTPVDAQGVVSNHNISSLSFALNNGLLVDYRNLPFGVNETAGLLADGAFVQVVGTRENEGTLEANEITVINRSIGVAGQQLEIEGIVANLDSTGKFTLNGQPVQAGESDMPIENGMRIEVEGLVDESGTLQAEEVQVRVPANLTISSIIDQVDRNARKLVIFGKSISITDATQFVDASANEDQTFGIEDLYAGEIVLLRVNNSDDDLLLNQVKRVDVNAKTYVIGEVNDFNPENNLVFVAGIMAVANDKTHFINLLGNEFSRATFFQSLDAGHARVKIEGTEFNDVLIAKTIQLLPTNMFSQ